MYIRFGNSIRDHLDREVKRRGCGRLHWDASYKEAKHLAQAHGTRIFKALITGTDEFGEIRVQFHVVTDGQDQFAGPIAYLLETLAAYGHELPTLFFTDKPKDDDAFFKQVIPSLQAMQNRLDGFIASPEVAAPVAEFEDLNITIIKKATLMASPLTSLRNLVRALPTREKVISIDCEWNTAKDSQGRIVANDKVALIQLGYFEGDVARALLLPVRSLQTLPPALTSLFTDPSITCIGRNVGGDLAKIGRVKCADKMVRVERLDLDTMAKVRGVVRGRSNTLQRLALVTLGVNMDKDPTVRCSKWSTCDLSPKQRQYAAMDVIVPLRIHKYLLAKPDLTERLAPAGAFVGCDMDIVPPHGNLVTMATRAGEGNIVADTELERLPAGVTRRRVNTESRMVRVTKVHDESFVVTGLSRGKGKSVVTLRDFGAPPFKLQLPLKVIAPHHAPPPPPAVAADDEAAEKAFGAVVDAVAAAHSSSSSSPSPSSLSPSSSSSSAAAAAAPAASAAADSCHEDDEDDNLEGPGTEQEWEEAEAAEISTPRRWSKSELPKLPPPPLLQGPSTPRSWTVPRRR